MYFEDVELLQIPLKVQVNTLDEEMSRVIDEDLLKTRDNIG